MAVTTCDTGNWLRLPIEKGYIIDLKVSGKTNLTLTMKEYSVYNAKTVRTVTKDKKYNWKNLSVVKGDQIKWVLPQAAKNGKSKLPFGAYNYIKLNKAAPDKVKIRTYVKARKKAIIVNWRKVSGATGYVVQYRKAGTSKWTTKKTAKATYTIRKLKKGVRYDVRVAAVKKTGSGTFRGKYSAVSHRYIQNVGPVKAKAGKGKIKVTWKKDKKSTGYKVCIARNKAMTKGLKVITVKGKNKTSRTIRNLKKGTRYYVEVHAIRPKGKTEYTGSSATKAAKVR